MSIKRIYVIRIKEENSGINKFRLIDPHVKLQQMFGDDFFIEFGVDSDIMETEKLRKYDAVYYHIALEQVDQIAVQTQKLKDLGIKLWLDVDDYWKYHPEHPYAKIAIKIKLAEKSVQALKKANAVFTTSDFFASKIKQYNKNVFCLPNAINFDEKQCQVHDTPHSTLNIGYVAGASHLSDIKLLRGILTAVNRKPYEIMPQMHLCGFNVQNKTRDECLQSTWFKMETEFTENYNLKNKRYIQFLHEFTETEFPNTDDMEYRRVWTKSIYTYMNIYDNLDICLAPLKSIEFNNYKSNLKMLEAGAKKKPIIVSPVEPYTSIAVHGKNCLVIQPNKEHKQWMKYAVEMVESPQMRVDLGENLHELVRKDFDLSNVCTLRAQIYKNLL